MPLIKKVHKNNSRGVNSAQVSGASVPNSPVPKSTVDTTHGNADTPPLTSAPLTTPQLDTPPLPLGANWSGIGTKLDWSGTKLRAVHEKAIVIAFNTDIVADMNRKLAGGPGKFPPTPEQSMFLEELSRGGNITLKALAGTGKSTTIRMGIAELGKPAESRTVHSLGNQVWRQIHSYAQIAEDKVRIILDDFEAQHPQHKGMLYQCGRYNITRIVDILKQCGVGILLKPEPETVLSLIDRYGIDLAHADNYGNTGQPTSAMVFAVEVALAVLKLSTDLDPQVIDFNDQLRAPLVHNVPDYMFPKFRHVFVDEAQDLSELRCAVMSRMVAPDGQIVVVGDSFQCQPTGTQVHTTKRGLIPIEDIQVGDELVSYSSGSAYFPGTRSQGRMVLKKSSRHYDGPLVRLETDSGKVSRYTPNHRCVVRLSHDNDKYAVYVMQKGKWARVGMCRLAYPSGCGVAMRARQENADRAWILTVKDSMDEALLTEERLSALFGLSQTIFTNNQQNRPTPEFIDSLYSWLAKQDNMLHKLDNCLRFFGRRYEYPFWSKAAANYVGKYSFVTQACNLLPEAMMVKTFDGDPRDTTWERFTTTQQSYAGVVYSLEVEKTEGGRRVYVADGIVTHNSIYGFSGAMTNAMENMTKQFNCNELALTVTHRCPKKVVELAREWVPDYKAAESNAIGSVTHIPEGKFRWQCLEPSDAVLCRVNKPLMDLAFQCVANGKGVRVEGRDIGQTIKGFMQKWPSIKTLPALDSKMCEYLAAQKEKLNAKNREQQAAKVEEKVELVRSVIAGCIDNRVTRVEDAIKFIDNLFTNGDRDKRQLTTFSSVHKAKGREWNRVYLLGRNEYMPSKRVLVQGIPEFIKQEDNLQYVAVTRVMKDLIEIDVEAKKKEGRMRDDSF